MALTLRQAERWAADLTRRAGHTYAFYPVAYGDGYYIDIPYPVDRFHTIISNETDYDRHKADLRELARLRAKARRNPDVASWHVHKFGGGKLPYYLSRGGPNSGQREDYKDSHGRVIWFRSLEHANRRAEELNRERTRNPWMQALGESAVTGTGVGMGLVLGQLAMSKMLFSGKGKGQQNPKRADSRSAMMSVFSGDSNYRERGYLRRTSWPQEYYHSGFQEWLKRRGYIHVLPGVAYSEATQKEEPWVDLTDKGRAWAARNPLSLKEQIAVYLAEGGQLLSSALTSEAFRALRELYNEGWVFVDGAYWVGARRLLERYRAPNPLPPGWPFDVPVGRRIRAAIDDRKIGVEQGDEGVILAHVGSGATSGYRVQLDDGRVKFFHFSIVKRPRTGRNPSGVSKGARAVLNPLPPIMTAKRNYGRVFVRGVSLWQHPDGRVALITATKNDAVGEIYKGEDSFWQTGTPKPDERLYPGPIRQTAAQVARELQRLGFRKLDRNPVGIYPGAKEPARYTVLWRDLRSGTDYPTGPWFNDRPDAVQYASEFASRHPISYVWVYEVSPDRKRWRSVWTVARGVNQPGGPSAWMPRGSGWRNPDSSALMDQQLLLENPSIPFITGAAKKLYELRVPEALRTARDEVKNLEARIKDERDRVKAAHSHLPDTATAYGTAGGADQGMATLLQQLGEAREKLAEEERRTALINRNPEGQGRNLYSTDAFRHEDVADWRLIKRAHPRVRVRTIVQGRHRIRVAFWPGGSVALSVLHPLKEKNPCQETDVLGASK